MAKAFALEKPKTREKLLGFIADGLSDAGAAAAMTTKRLSVTRQAVTAFRLRHGELVEAKIEEAVAEVKQRWISDKDLRLAELEHWYDLTRKEADEFGITVVERVTETKGEGDEATEVVTETRDYRAALVKEARGILRQASEELGQLPRAEQHNTVNVGIIVRQIEGYTGALG